jgi:NitT/TauT family transport system substrate-binding protein
MSYLPKPALARRFVPTGLIVVGLCWLLGCTAAPSASTTTAARPPEAAATRPPQPTAASPTVAPATPAGQSQATTALQPLTPPVPVKVGVIGIAAESGIYIALEKGYFAAEGLDVELSPFRGGAEQMPLLATGGLDFGAGGPEPSVFNAVMRDAGVKIVGPNVLLDERSASSALIVRSQLKDSGQVQSGRDLAGRTVALNTEGGSVQVYLDRILANAGLTLSDVRVVALPFADMMPAMANGAVDAAWQVEPFITIGGRQGISQVLYLVGEVYPGSIANVLLLSPVFAKEHDEAAKRFVTAYLRGQRDYYRAFVKDEGGKEEIIPILIKHTAVKDTGLYTNLGMHGVDPNGYLNPRTFEEMQEYFLKYGTQQQRLDFSKVIDQSYVDYALQRLGRMPN